MKKIVFSVFAILMVVLLSACGEPSGSRQDIYTTQENANNIQENQPTPTDLEYSLERYNLIRRAYWVNGQREKALAKQLAEYLGVTERSVGDRLKSHGGYMVDKNNGNVIVPVKGRE